MASYEEVVPPHHVREILLAADHYFEDAAKFFEDAAKRERDADERARLIARTHADGWKLVARAINDGFALLARAVESRR